MRNSIESNWIFYSYFFLIAQICWQALTVNQYIIVVILVHEVYTYIPKCFAWICYLNIPVAFVHMCLLFLEYPHYTEATPHDQWTILLSDIAAIEFSTLNKVHMTIISPGFLSALVVFRSLWTFHQAIMKTAGRDILIYLDPLQAQRELNLCRVSASGQRESINEVSIRRVVLVTVDYRVTWFSYGRF